MGRVKPAGMREGIKVQRGNGLPFFQFEMGKKYKILFPTLKGETDIFAYMEAVHSLTLNGKYSSMRCINQHYQVSDESKQAVVKVDENGELSTDPASGRVLNDGTCPLCELEKMYRSYVFHEVEKWKLANPNHTDEERSAEYKRLFNQQPVEASFNTNDEGTKVVTTKALLGVVFMLDEKNSYVLDEEGYPTYAFNVFNLSDARYNKLFSVAQNGKEYMSETLLNITDEFGLAWTEFIWDFPLKDDRAASGKDLTIAVVPSGHSAVEKFNDLVNKIQADLEDVEKFEQIFENLPSIRVRTIPEIEKELQGRLEKYRDYMSNIEKEQLDGELKEDEKYLSEKDAEKLMDGELSQGSDVGTSLEDKEVSGEQVFLD